MRNRQGLVGQRMAYDIVISYSRRNREIADSLVSLLRERKLSVWYDRMIKPGTDWRDEIANAIAGARILLILFSRIERFTRTPQGACDRRPAQAAYCSRPHRAGRAHRPLRIRTRQAPMVRHFHRLASGAARGRRLHRRSGQPAAKEEAARKHETSKDEQAAEPQITERGSDETWDRRGRADGSKDRIIGDAHSGSPTAPPSAEAQTMRRSFLAAAMTRVSRPVSSVSWKVTIPFALMLGLVGLIGAASAQDAGGAIGRITVNIAPPLWLILQIWLARQAGIDRPYGASANVVARVLALAGVFAPAFPTNVVIAIVVLVIFGGLGLIIFLLVQTVRKSRRAAFWILPLVGSVLLFMGFAAWRNSPSVAQAYSGVGLVIGCVAYLIASRIGTSPSQAPP